MLKHSVLLHRRTGAEAKYRLHPSMYVNHQVVLEYDPETKSYTATVPGLPIVVDADSEEEALRLAKEGISVCLKEASSRKRTEKREKPVQVKIVTVEV